MNNSDAGTLMALGVMAIVGLVIFVIALAIQAFVCYLLKSYLDQLPIEHRKMESWQPWLLMIPCFGLVWNFFVYLKISDSYISYFNSIGRTDVGDCGKSLGLAFSICVAVSIIPYLGMLTGIASLVLVILYLVKLSDLKNQVKLAASAGQA